MEFYKYHGAGNDFILFDNRDGKINPGTKDFSAWVKLLCHRRFGIGADGILLLENASGYDFKMIYINSDGSRGSMCGNGGRCIVHFAHNILKIVRDPKRVNPDTLQSVRVKFLAVDGEHEAEILDDGRVKLKMQDVKDVGERNGLPFICQGTTPHNIKYVENLKDFPVFTEGKKIADSDPERVNTNFVEILDGVLHVRTYERGVEDETWACGTGATSVAIASHHLGKIKENVVHISMPGGELTVEFDPPAGGQVGTYQNIYLTGPAVCVFKGEV